MDEIKTVPLREQLRASRAIYAQALEEIERLDDAELSRVLDLASASTVARALDLASDSTVERVLDLASDSTVARALGLASDSTVARVLDLASASTVARVLDLASPSTVERVLDLASPSTVERVLGLASDSTVARVLDLASPSTVARVLDLASDSTVERVLDLASDSTVERVLDLEVPVVPDLDAKVLAAVGTDGAHLNMAAWHCGTTHCRAGWAITLAGHHGTKLEAALGSEAAGRLIYEASTGRPAPDFYAGDTCALEDIRKCAALAQGGAA